MRSTAEIKRIRASFDDYAAFVEALRALKASRFRHFEAYGPTSLAELRDLMPHKGSPVRGWTTAGALTGLVTFLLMCVLSSLIFNLITGGKPPVSNVPFVVPTYEGTILIGGIVAMVAVVVYAALRSRELPVDYDPRVTGDTYAIYADCSPSEVERINAILREAGASEIYESA